MRDETCLVELCMMLSASLNFFVDAAQKGHFKLVRIEENPGAHQLSRYEFPSVM